MSIDPIKDVTRGPKKSIDDELSVAHGLITLGDLEQAKIKYFEILKTYGESSHVLMQLGLLEGQLENLENAVEHFSRVKLLEPNNINARTALALCKQNLNEFEQAINHYEEALEILNTQVSQTGEADHLDLKRECLDQLCQLELRLNDFGRALNYAMRAHQIRTDLTSYITLTIIYLQLSLHVEALSIINSAIVNYPDEVRVYLLKGLILEKAIHYETAESDNQQVLIAYSNAIQIAPNAAQTFYIKGNFLSSIGDWQSAIDNYKLTLELNSSHLMSLNNALVAYQTLGLYEQAIDCIDRFVLETNKNPNLITQLGSEASQFFFNAGALLFLESDFDKARQYFEQSLLKNSQYPQLLGAYYHLRMRMCDWESTVKMSDGNVVQELSFEEFKELLLKGVKQQTLVTHPFALLTATDDGHIHRLANLKWTQSISGSTKTRKRTEGESVNVKSDQKKIRVGYFSNDFREHATAYLIASLFELHNRESFEIYAYSWGTDDQSIMRKRLINSVDHWFDVKSLSDKDFITLIRLHELDIAIDLKGHTEGARTQIFAARVAPVQIGFLGYPGTMGADFIDYCIADKTVIPAQLQSTMTEHILYMPESYQINDEKRDICAIKTMRKDHRLRDGDLIFCSFNSSYKITPFIFDCWMGILREFSNSVLWLLEDNSTACHNLRQMAMAKGVEGDRLIFAPKLQLGEHLERLSHADLFLDTFPCNAHTSASDALWTGVPLVTLVGQTFASRVAASLLTHTGLSELITCTGDEYREKIRNLASNPDQLRRLKAGLLDRKKNKKLPLFDSKKFTENFENILRSVCR